MGLLVSLRHTRSNDLSDEAGSFRESIAPQSSSTRSGFPNDTDPAEFVSIGPKKSGRQRPACVVFEKMN
jgi:hypothetical protein